MVVFNQQRVLGFTVVELVVVIILLSILSATALSRFVQPGVFAPGTLAATLSAQVHYAALSAQTDTSPVTLVVTPDTDVLRMQVASLTSILRSEEPSIANVVVSLVNGASTYGLASGQTWTLTFAGKGDVVDSSVGVNVLNPELGIEVIITGDSERVLCIQPIGTVSEEAC